MNFKLFLLTSLNQVHTSAEPIEISSTKTVNRALHSFGTCTLQSVLGYDQVQPTHSTPWKMQTRGYYSITK